MDLTKTIVCYHKEAFTTGRLTTELLVGMKLPLLLVACISFFQAAFLVAAAAGESLYLYRHNADPVKEYTGAVENDFTKSTNPRVVEFYSPHCVSTVNTACAYSLFILFCVRIAC